MEVDELEEYAERVNIGAAMLEIKEKSLQFARELHIQKGEI